jgi:hypothetical protein
LPNYTYDCAECGRVIRRGVPVDAMHSQTCECGRPLKHVLDLSAVQICIPIYMQAGTADRFPVDALIPKTEQEKRTHAEADARPLASRRWV